MEEGAGSQTEQFYKRRRDLMLLSIAILLIKIFAIKIEKLNFLGNVVEIGRSEFLPIILVIFLTYYVLRFFQYGNDIKDKGFLEQFNKAQMLYFKKYLLRCVKAGDTNDISNQTILISLKFKYMGSAVGEIGQFSHMTPAEGWEHENSMPISVKNKYVLDIQSWLHVCITTRLATDFILPYLLAASALVSFLI